MKRRMVGVGWLAVGLLSVVLIVAVDLLEAAEGRG